MRSLKLAIPAKINLHLQVLGRRRDGFHEVSTLLQSIDLFDDLEAEPAPAGTLELTVQPAESVVADESNLVLRAARRLAEHSAVEKGACLHLEKHIPIGAGLGGGSADAAAAITLLEELWSLELGDGERLRLASALGSDVPFFLYGGLAAATGRGERISPLADLPELGVVVATPDVHASTENVYGALRLTGTGHEDRVYSSAPGGGLCWERMVNDLQAVVCELWPEVGDALQRMQATGPLRAAVTGSGSSVFGVFPSRRKARLAARTMDGSLNVHCGATLPRALSRPRVRRLR